MADDQAYPARDLVPVARSLRLRFELSPLAWRWGASWAALCGAAAVGPGLWAVESAPRFLMAWFLAVPLLGAAWSPWLGWRRSAAPAATPEAPGGEGRRSPPGRRHLRRPGDRLLETGIAALLALGLGWLLGPGPLAVVGIALALVLLPGPLLGRCPAPVGAARSGLELVLPWLLVWLALGGARSLPAPWLVLAGGSGALAAWLAANGLVVALLLAWALAHHGASTVHRQGELAGRRAELAAGYLLAAVALALAERPLGAAGVALLFVLQWPFQARFRAGELRWHFAATTVWAMAAMGISALAAGWGGP